MYVSDLLKMYPMNVEGDRLVCGPRFPLQLGVALVVCYFFSNSRFGLPWRSVVFIVLLFVAWSRVVNCFYLVTRVLFFFWIFGRADKLLYFLEKCETYDVIRHWEEPWTSILLFEYHIRHFHVHLMFGVK